jgi:hypothetical protein
MVGVVTVMGDKKFPHLHAQMESGRPLSCPVCVPGSFWTARVASKQGFCVPPDCSD